MSFWDVPRTLLSRQAWHQLTVPWGIEGLFRLGGTQTKKRVHAADGISSDCAATHAKREERVLIDVIPCKNGSKLTPSPYKPNHKSADSGSSSTRRHWTQWRVNRCASEDEHKNDMRDELQSFWRWIAMTLSHSERARQLMDEEGTRVVARGEFQQGGPTDCCKVNQLLFRMEGIKVLLLSSSILDDSGGTKKKV